MKKAKLCMLLIFAVFIGCVQGQISSVARADLFTLEIGPMEDQLNLFSPTWNPNQTNIVMRDGFFYISDTAGSKIVRYNSYGDLLFVIYNEETNPPPITVQRGSYVDGIATRWAIPFPLRQPGAIAVDSRNHIFVADSLHESQWSHDAEDGTLFNNIVLHFDESGRYLRSFGQDGVNGQPFPRIVDIFTSVNDELAVVCVLASGWNIYWFDAEGALLYLVHFQRDNLPIPTGELMSYASVDAIMALPDERHLFIKVDYFRMVGEESDNQMNAPYSSVIWIMDVETGIYLDWIPAPLFEHTLFVDGAGMTQRLPYAMLGVIKNGRVVLSFPVDGGYSLLVLTAGTREQRLGFIQVQNYELEFNTFSLSSEGILSALLATEWEVRVVWWRTERLMGELTL